MAKSNSSYHYLIDVKDSRFSNIDFNDTNSLKKYNIFVDIYNNEVNQISNTKFKKVKDLKFYNLFDKFFSSFSGKFATLILLLIPGVNLVIFLIILTMMILFENAYSIFKENEKKVKDPFEKMIYSPELCKNVDKTHHFYEIELNGKIKIKIKILKIKEFNS